MRQPDRTTLKPDFDPVAGGFVDADLPKCPSMSGLTGSGFFKNPLYPARTFGLNC